MGSEDATEEMLLLCRPQIFRIVRSRLGKELRSQYDSDDFVQSVWQAFFEHRSRVLQFTRPDSLVAFLSRVASNKVVDACRKRLDGGEGNKKKEPLYDDMKPGSQEPTGELPSPSEVAMRNEDWDQLLSRQPDRQRQMLELRANGTTVAEIAAMLKVSERTVRRVFEKLKRRQK
jgi:RNA polymerase sigma factor (sigma-70 family)